MDTSHQRVWLIDKNKPWRLGAEQALHSSGFLVESGDDLQRLPHSQDPDLVILGCVRPGETEKQALDYFVERNVPVVVLASIISDTETRNLFLAGATDAGTRPSSWDKLRQVVNVSLQALMRRAQRTEKAFTARTL